MSCPLGSQCVCRPCTHDLSVEVFSSSIVLGLCCSLMVVALLLSCGWRCGIGLAVLLRRSTKRVRKWLARLSLSRPGHTQRVQSRLPILWCENGLRPAVFQDWALLAVLQES